MKKTILIITAVFFSLLFCVAQNNLPIGYLDNVDQYSGNGWAYDQDAGTQAIDVHIYIDGRLYAAVTANLSRPDLVTAGITPNPEHGYSFTITGIDLTRTHEVIVYAINYGGGANPSLTNCPATIGTQPSGDASISNVAGPSNITITTTQRLAGAIHSLTWNGKEFIDSYDHGRQLQSATSFNGWGECFNPTEAGSAQDGTGNTSTSFLQYLNASGNYLETQTLPAFWTQPGYTAPGCGSAINTTPKSSHYFHKKVTIGMPGMAHVIQYNTEFDIPAGESYSSGTFEVLTGYMPVEFSVFWNYDPNSQQLTSLSDGPGEQGIPIIFTTTDNNYAMGIYSPDLPDPIFPGAGYGRFRFGDCTKWNCVFRESSVSGSTYKYRSYVIVGSLTNVEVSMVQLYNYFKITADFSADTVCAGTPTTFTDITTGANSETIYQWDINNNGSIDDTTSGNFSYVFNSAGTYSVKLNVINGVASDHQSSIIKNVLVLAPLTAGAISGNTTVCGGISDTYSISPVPGATSYTWSLPPGWIGSSASTSINVTPDSYSGTISVAAVNSCGNGAISSLAITVNEIPATPIIVLNGNDLQSTAPVGNQWYNDFGLISGATLQIYTPAASGNYYVIVTDNGCISDTSNIIYVEITGDNNFYEQNYCFNIFPNPANDKLNIDIKENATLEILNTQGQIIETISLTEKTNNLDISNLHGGVYILRIKTDRGIATRKLIRQ